jgi:ribonuclease HII
MIVGIDEAGRGCVIGPMVMCAASIDQLEEFKLKELGVKDSKKLSPLQRERLFPEVERLCSTIVTRISAHELSKMMDTCSLNEIEAIKIAEMLNTGGVARGSSIFIDSPDNIPAHFGKRIERYLTKRMNLYCENKADDKHLIVGAASIVAKVIRDHEIEKIKKVVGVDFGSGYSSDVRTVEYLTAHREDKKILPYLRTKWITLTRMNQKKLSDY